MTTDVTARVRARPIVLDDFDVGAILEGAKTRHAVPIATVGPWAGRDVPDGGTLRLEDGGGRGVPRVVMVDAGGSEVGSRDLPFRIGDRLLVHERFVRRPGGDGREDTVHRPADMTGLPASAEWRRTPDGRAVWRWRDRTCLPASMMPPEACRLALTVVATGVHRLSSTPRADMREHGFVRSVVGTVDGPKRLWPAGAHCACGTLDDAFAGRWEERFNRQGFCADDQGRAYDADPWVQAILFTVERLEDGTGVRRKAA